MRALLHHIEQAILPRRCASCGGVLTREEPGWCGPCAFTWSRQSQSSLERFDGQDWAFGHTWLRMKGPEERRLIHAVKYGGCPELGRRVGRCMARESLAACTPWQRESAGPEGWALVPIPLHASRERKRGYNQSHQLALGWADQTGMDILGLILRRRAGRSMTRSDRSQRIARSRQVYGWNPAHTAPIEGLQGLILMDDVVTTGSTLKSAHTALRTRWNGPIGFIVALDARR